MYALAPLVLALVSANVVAAASAFSSPLLAAREDATAINEPPTQCRPTCDGAVSTIDTCKEAAPPDARCVCDNAQFAGALLSCFDCVIGADKKQETVDMMQRQYDVIKNQCRAAGSEGFADRTFTLNGANGAAALSGSALVGAVAILAGLL